MSNRNIQDIFLQELVDKIQMGSNPHVRVHEHSFSIVKDAAHRNVIIRGLVNYGGMPVYFHELISEDKMTEAMHSIHVVNELAEKFIVKNGLAPVDDQRKSQTSREEVYRAIDSERDYQDHVWGDFPGFDIRPVQNNIITMDVYMDKLKVAWTDNPNDPEVLNIIRKITAVGVHAMEVNGAPTRYED